MILKMKMLYNIIIILYNDFNNNFYHELSIYFYMSFTIGIYKI